MADKLKPRPEKREAPICWLPWTADNSASGQVWVDGKRWGPFENQLLQMSYGMSCVFLSMIERVDGQAQGAMVKLPIQFNSGLMRGKFNPLDGQLYVCGLRGWQTNGARDCVFQRVRYTSKPILLPQAFHAKRDGVEITFTEPLNKAEAEDTSNYSAFSADVNSNEEPQRFSPTTHRSYDKHSSEMGDEVRISRAILLADNRTVKLEIPDMRPVSNLVIRTRIQSAEGAPIRTEIYSTINSIKN